VARHRNRGETLDLATNVLVIGGGPSAGWAAVCGQRPHQFDRRVRTGMAVLEWAHRQHPTYRDVFDGAGLDHARHRGF